MTPIVSAWDGQPIATQWVKSVGTRCLPQLRGKLVPRGCPGTVVVGKGRAHWGKGKGLPSRDWQERLGKEWGKTGNSKEKGKGKGNREFFGQRYHCGDWGHSQNWCPKKEGTPDGQRKGKGRGKTKRSAHNVEEEQNPEDQRLGNMEGTPKRPFWVFGSVDTSGSPQEPPLDRGGERARD